MGRVGQPSSFRLPCPTPSIPSLCRHRFQTGEADRRLSGLERCRDLHERVGIKAVEARSERQRIGGAGLASVINATTPFWTIVVAAVLTTDEKITGPKLAGVALGIAGTAVMIGPGLLAGLGGPAWAKFALLGTAMSYAFAFMVARRLKDIPPAVTAAGQLTASSALMIPIVLAVHGPHGLFSASAEAWASVFGLALLATALAYILYFRLVAEAGATNTSLVTLIVPVCALLLGALFLGERLEMFEFAGMGLIGLGLITIDGRLLRRRPG